MSWLVRYAGIAYLASFAVPVATWLVFFAGEVDGSDLDTAMATVRSSAASLRIAVLCETLGSAIHLALGLLLYAILRATGRHLALGALVFKIAESILTAVIALSHLTALSMLELQVHPEAASTLLPVTGFVGVYVKLTAIPGIFFGASMLLFVLLLARAALVPRWVARLGVASYLLVIVYDALCIAVPQYAGAAAIQTLGTGPVCLSSLLIGVWLTATNARVTPAAQEATR